MVSRKLRQKILRNYYNLKYPGSYQGVATFRQSLKDKSNIEISHSALRKILKSSLPYQVNVVKSKKIPKRANYSRGVYQEYYIDPIFIPYKVKNENNKQVNDKQKNFLALVVVDVHSRMLYSTKLNSINPQSLKRAFTVLLQKGMPQFSIVRCDRDKSLNKLANNYFANKGMLLLTRRSVHHMGFLEGIIRNIKIKFIKNMREDKNPQGWTPKRLEKALADVTHSFNHTKNSATGFTPASCNFPEFDPELRLRLYKDRKIEKFEDFYTETLRLHQKANTPEKNDDKPNFDESPNSFKRGDLVYIDFKKPDVGRSAYNIQRGPLYEISKVNVQSSPYLYKLLNLKTNKPLYGFYYGRELARGDLSDLKIDRIIKKRTTPDKRKLIYVSLKGLNESYNRWIEKPEEK